jgi:hypothetical protein
MDDDADIEDWKQNAENRDEENYQFLRSMKFQDYGFDPDGPMIDDTYGILCEARSEGRSLQHHHPLVLRELSSERSRWADFWLGPCGPGW